MRWWSMKSIKHARVLYFLIIVGARTARPATISRMCRGMRSGSERGLMPLSFS